MRPNPRARRFEPDPAPPVRDEVPLSTERAANDVTRGEPLNEAMRSLLEPRFGADLGAVRVHATEPGQDVALALGADAVAAGRDVYFAPGRYQPETTVGRALLAHEVAHTLQTQSSEDVPPLAVSPAPADGRLEAEALLAAGAVTRDEPAAVAPTSAGSPVVQRQTAVTRPPMKPDDCKDLLGKITETAIELLQIVQDLIADRKGMQWDHQSKQNPMVGPHGNPYGSVEGHQEKFTNRQNRLRQLIAEWDDNHCNDSGLRVPQDYRELVFRSPPSPAPRPKPDESPKPWNPPGSEPTPSRAREVVAGAALGAAIGTAVGGAAGAILGAGGGTLVAPGVGTVGGGAAGAVAGLQVGAAVGGTIGAAAGGVYRWMKGGTP